MSQLEALRLRGWDGENELADALDAAAESSPRRCHLKLARGRARAWLADASYRPTGVGRVLGCSVHGL